MINSMLCINGFHFKCHLFIFRMTVSNGVSIPGFGHSPQKKINPFFDRKTNVCFFLVTYVYLLLNNTEDNTCTQ